MTKARPEPIKTSYADRITWINAVRDTVDLPSNAKLVALVICSYGDMDGDSIFPTQARLVATTQLCESAVRRALKDLRNKGFLWREEQGSLSGRMNIADRYRLVLPVDYETRYRFVPAKGPIGDIEEWRPTRTRGFAA